VETGTFGEDITTTAYAFFLKRYSVGTDRASGAINATFFDWKHGSS